MKIGGSLRAVWITIFVLGLRCESQGGPGLVVIHYNAYELPSKGSWAGFCPPSASVGNRLFSGPLTKLVPWTEPKSHLDVTKYGKMRLGGFRVTRT